jgi:hypothetical protein
MEVHDLQVQLDDVMKAKQEVGDCVSVPGDYDSIFYDSLRIDACSSVVTTMTCKRNWKRMRRTPVN